MSHATDENLKLQRGRAAASSGRIFVTAFSVLLLSAAGVLFLHDSTAYSASPKLATAHQITHDGLAKRSVFSDGSYLYITEWTGGHQQISKIVLSTGERS